MCFFLWMNEWMKHVLMIVYEFTTFCFGHPVISIWSLCEKEPQKMRFIHWIFWMTRTCVVYGRDYEVNMCNLVVYVEMKIRLQMLGNLDNVETNTFSLLPFPQINRKDKFFFFGILLNQIASTIYRRNSLEPWHE